MDADWSVELGAGDAVMEVPWASADGSLRYVDLNGHPERIGAIEEARQFPELAEFLRRMNAPASGMASVKCDVWKGTEMEPAEEIYGASHKVGSYCDVIFREQGRRADFAMQESFVKKAAALLRTAPEIPASAELVVRRCVFHDDESAAVGLAVTAFVSGYGNREEAARRQWGIGLQLVANALLQAASITARAE